jgi:hypothetical protein
MLRFVPIVVAWLARLRDRRDQRRVFRARELGEPTPFPKSHQPIDHWPNDGCPPGSESHQAGVSQSTKSTASG